MTDSRKATLIVLAWNRWDLTRKCLETLRLTDLSRAEVLVVDNGSTDETPNELARQDWIRVLTLPKNLGFVRGNNAGIEAADPSSDIVLLNNDLVFGQRDWLARLRASAHAAPDVGIVGCRLTLPDGRLLHAGTYILPDTMWGQQIGSLQKDLGQFGTDREVSGIVFACAYIKRELVSAIGGLSTQFESYFEDTDYCLRARKAGFKTMVCGGVTIEHDEHGSTHANDEARLTLFQNSRKAFSNTWAKELEARYRLDITWQSIMNFPTGYAMSCREYIRALDDLGVRTTYRYVYGPGSVFPREEPEDSRDYLLNVVRSRKAPAHPPISVVYGQGDVFQRNSGRYKIGFTMLEVDGFPAEWVRQANSMDEVWVPSDFNRDGFVNSGLTRPVHVVPLGVDLDFFHPHGTRIPSPYGEFVFFSSFEWGERKYPELLLKTFNEVFSAHEPVRLVCKIINVDPGVNLKERISSLGLRDAGGRMSFLVNLEFPHYQLPTLYRSTDCFVSAGRGEGWDMPLMEAMACGLPSIVTDWGAHTMFADDSISYPLRIQGTVPAVAKCPYYRGFAWADPDVEHFRYLLRHVYENRDEARQKGLAAARTMAERWSWRAAAERIVQRLEAIG
jgi:hypothetical protein